MKQKLKLMLLVLISSASMIGCSKEASFKYVYKVSYTSPKVNTIVTSYYTYNKNQNHHNSQWIEYDYLYNNMDALVSFNFDTLWVDSLGLVEWRVP